MPAYRTQGMRALRACACVSLEGTAKIFLQHRRFRLLGVPSLRGRVGSRLKNVTVPRARNQFRPIYSHFDAAPLSRIRLILWIVTEAVLPAQFFGDHLKSVTEILLLGIVEPGAGHPRQII